MSMRVRQLVTVTVVAIAGCAQAPSFDDEGFVGAVRPAVDGSADSGGVALDASLGGPLGSEAEVLGGIDVGGWDARTPTQLVVDAAPAAAFDANLGLGLGAGSDGGGADASPGALAVDSGGAAGADAAARASDAGGEAAVREAAAATCNPFTCANNCLLFPRCCNEDDQCACLDPATRQCSLPSL